MFRFYESEMLHPTVRVYPGFFILFHLSLDKFLFGVILFTITVVSIDKIKYLLSFTHNVYRRMGGLLHIMFIDEWGVFYT